MQYNILSNQNHEYEISILRFIAKFSKNDLVYKPDRLHDQ